TLVPEAGCRHSRVSIRQTLPVPGHIPGSSSARTSPAHPGWSGHPLPLNTAGIPPDRFLHVTSWLFPPFSKKKHRGKIGFLLCSLFFPLQYGRYPKETIQRSVSLRKNIVPAAARIPVLPGLRPLGALSGIPGNTG